MFSRLCLAEYINFTNNALSTAGKRCRNNVPPASVNNEARGALLRTDARSSSADDARRRWFSQSQVWGYVMANYTAGTGALRYTLLP